MSACPAPHAARLRGTAAGLLTVALSLAGHAAGGGVTPSGAAAIQLLLIGATAGAVASLLSRAGEIGVMVSLLAVGQLGAHVVLSAAGHGHASPQSGWVMAAAHLAATALGAMLLCIGDRLCRKLSRVVRAAARQLPLPVPVPKCAVVRTADQPLRSALLLAASMSHRGPPVCAAH